MCDSSTDWPYPDLAKFEVVALGCHHKLHKELARFFRENHGIEAFQLVEYFLQEPVRRGGDSPDLVCFPFLRRLLEQNIFQLRGRDGSLEVAPLTRDLREEVELEEADGRYRPRRYVLPFDRTVIGQTVFSTWLGKDRLDSIPTQNWFQNYSVDQWRKHEQLVQQAPDEYRDLYLVEFNLAARFWMSCADGITTIVGGYPICSDDIFYGYFVVVWPEPSPHSHDGDHLIRESEIPENIVQHLKVHARDYYVPTLALLHNSIWEDQFHTAIKKEPDDVDELNSQIDALPVSQWALNANDPLERGLACLWKKRKDLLSQPDGIAAVKDTLLFRRYNIASPGMVDNIKQIIQRAPHFHQPDNPGAKLPAALIYGEAGAGKDTMAKLIPLFTMASWCPDEETDDADHRALGYFGRKPRAINMSALKPNALFGPLFQGMNVSEPHLNIPSILTLQKNKDNDESDNNEPGVFILDELNSLDVDLQGVLLRILENGEITPLFDIKPSHIRHLMIGVVNEDPEILTRESETRDLLRIRKFTGEFIGNALNEFFIRGRRLRPDLFYRLRRGLYIRLPSLRKRREDIPILFYFECAEAVEQELKNATMGVDSDMREHRDDTTDSIEDVYVYIELKAYESLMERNLDWPGNVRQLQDVAMEAAVMSVKQHGKKDRQTKPGIICVSDDIVCEVLSKHFPSVFDERIGKKCNGRNTSDD